MVSQAPELTMAIHNLEEPLQWSLARHFWQQQRMILPVPLCPVIFEFS